MSDEAGALVAGSAAQYYPFGAFRGTRPATNPDVSDLGYTGHRSNNTGANDLGLIYMNARYYIGSIGRFASPDTLVPDPANPQSLNRYTYSLNNPVKYVDPTGHCAENGDEECWSLAEELAREYDLGLEFLGVMNMSEMRFFILGLNQARGINNDLPDQIISTINEMAEIYPEWLVELNKSVNLDAIGVRLEGSYGLLVGIQGDLDLVFNFQSWEFSVLVTPGFQAGAILGGSGGAGVFLGFNAPTNDAFWGWCGGVTAQVVPAGVGGGIQYSRSGEAASLVLGINAGEELDVSAGGGYTFEILRVSSSPYGAASQVVFFPQLVRLRGLWYNRN